MKKENSALVLKANEYNNLTEHFDTVKYKPGQPLSVRIINT